MVDVVSEATYNPEAGTDGWMSGLASEGNRG